MSEKISEEMIAYVSVLAQLALSAGEQEAAGRDMEKMLAYIDKLKEVDTDGVEPATHVQDLRNVFREDEVTEGAGCRDVLGNAPRVKQGMFQVPRTVE